MKVFVPSWVKYKSTKFVWSVVTSLTSTDAKKASVFIMLVDIIFEVVAVETVVLIPDKFMNPMDWVPIPIKLVLNDVSRILRS